MTASRVRLVRILCVTLNAAGIAATAVAVGLVVLYGRFLEGLLGSPPAYHLAVGSGLLVAASLTYGSYAVLKGQAVRGGIASAVGAVVSLAFVAYYALLAPLSWLGILAYALPLAPFASSLIAWLRKEEVTGRALA